MSVPGLAVFRKYILSLALALSLPATSLVGPAAEAAAETSPLSGYVYREDGVTPIPNASITATLLDGDYPIRKNSASTTADGSYNFQALPSGSYIVQAVVEGYVDELYDNTYSWDKAARIKVAPPSRVAGINFVLDPGGSISGHVFQADGVTPLAQATVSVSRLHGDFNLHRESKTLSDGSFVIRTLPSGRYDVVARMLGYAEGFYINASGFNTATPVQVISPAVTGNVDFSLDELSTISGRITRSADGAPIAGAVISFENAEGNYTLSVRSDADGNYINDRAPAGYYHLKVTAPGYITEYDNGAYDADDRSHLIPVTPSTDTTNIDFALEPGGSISGYVYRDEGDTPLSMAAIFVYSFRENQKSHSPLGIYYSGLDGSYTIPGLPTGDYLIYVSHRDYIDQYYGGSALENSAKLVYVNAPETISRVDFSMSYGGSVAGRVYYPDESPAKYANVRVFSPDGYGRAIRINDDGSYAINGLPSGSYLVSALLFNYPQAFYPNAPDEKSAVPVNVVEGRITPNINLFFTSPGFGSISGTVFSEDGVTPLPRARIVTSPIQDTNKAFGAREVYCASNGTFILTDVPAGTYALQAIPMGWEDVPEYYGGAYNIDSAAQVIVAAGSDTRGIDFKVDKGGSIFGRVFQADGATPVIGITVRCQANFEIQGIPLQTTTDAYGNYRFNKLPKGSYTVNTISQDYQDYIGEYYDDVSALDSKSPTRINVLPPAEIGGINITLDSKPAAGVSQSTTLPATAKPDLAASISQARPDNAALAASPSITPVTGGSSFLGKYWWIIPIIAVSLASFLFLAFYIQRSRKRQDQG